MNLIETCQVVSRKTVQAAWSWLEGKKQIDLFDEDPNANGHLQYVWISQLGVYKDWSVPERAQLRPGL